MSDDLPQRLRDRAGRNRDCQCRSLRYEAAAEIERLRDEVAHAQNAEAAKCITTDMSSDDE